MTTLSNPDVELPLLRLMQRLSPSSDLAYAERPASIALGTEAWLLGFSLHRAPAGLDGPMVLRVLHTLEDRHQVAIEHAVQEAIAEQGYPAPLVLISSETDEPLGWPFLVMERLPGEIRPDLPDAVDQQMDALARLHSLDIGPFERALEARGVPAERYVGSSR